VYYGRPGADFHMARLEDIRRTYPGKEVIVTEFGWPMGPMRRRKSMRIRASIAVLPANRIRSGLCAKPLSNWRNENGPGWFSKPFQKTGNPPVKAVPAVTGDLRGHTALCLRTRIDTLRKEAGKVQVVIFLVMLLEKSVAHHRIQESQLADAASGWRGL